MTDIRQVIEMGKYNARIEPTMDERSEKGGVLLKKNQSIPALTLVIFFIVLTIFSSAFAQNNLFTSDTAIQMLQDGNGRFISGRMLHPNLDESRRETTFSNGQHPFATIIACSDSRVPVEILFDRGIGDIFTVRVAGNVADVDEIGSIEYGVDHLNTPLLVVLGHVRCGAVTAVARNSEVHGSIQSLVDNIIPAITITRANHPGLSGEAFIYEAVKTNVWQTVDDLFKNSTVAREKVRSGALRVIGAIYNIKTGDVSWLGSHPEQGRLLSYEGSGTAADQGKKTAKSSSQTVHGTSNGLIRDIKSHEVKPIEIKLAVEETINLLKTDWLKEQEEVHYDLEEKELSTVFWFTIIIPLLLAGIASSFFLSSAARKYSYKVKLYASFGTLVILAVIMGAAGYYYLDSVTISSHMETIAVEMDMNSNEIKNTLDEFLQHGIENRKYGDMMVENNHAQFKDLQNDIEMMKASGYLDARQFRWIREMDEKLSKYQTKFNEITEAFHEIETGKDILDELSRSVEKYIQTMVTAHKSELKNLEFGSQDMNAIMFQELILEHLTGMEILIYKIASEQAQFLLDKRAVRVKSMEKMIGLQLGYIHLLETELEKAEEKHRLEKIEEEIEAYADMLKKIIRDKAVIEQDTADIRNLLYAIESVAIRIGNQMKSQADEMVYEANIASVVQIIIVLFIGMLLSMLITRIITRPLNYAVEISEKISQGDLMVDISVDSNDETGMLLSAMKDMVENLKEIVSDIRQSSENVASASEEMASVSEEMTASAEQMSQGASEQAASAEEASASMEEMAANIRQNADNAIQTEKIAQKSAEDARNGGEAVLQTVSAMKKIAQKISIIEEISRQTDLLALNAAVEAARAGQHGKGFAVVASEVRKLSERSQKAAAEINKLSGSSVQVAENAGQMLEKLVPDIQKTMELVQEISAACTEQSTGAEQVNLAIQQLDQVIQANVATSEEASSTSEEMSASAESMASQAAELQHIIEFFKTAKIKGKQSFFRKNAKQSSMQRKSGSTFKERAAHKEHIGNKRSRQPSDETADVIGQSIDMGSESEDFIAVDDDEFENY